jgi:peptidyl-prolyl cis-trans isomerase B (cyclophilin B)
VPNTEKPGEDIPDGGDQLTNEQRRAEAKRKLEQRLATQESAARRRRRIILAASLTVVVAVVAAGGTFIVMKVIESRYTTCQYTPTPAAQNPFNNIPAIPPNLPPEQRTLAEQYRDQFVSGKAKQRTAPLPSNRQLKKGDLQATFQTTQGTLPITLKRGGAPCNVGAIASLIDNRYYDGTTCHRLTEGGQGKVAVLQCGDPTGTGASGPGWSSPDEFPTDLKTVPQDPQLAQFGLPSSVVYPRGTVAIANSYQPGQGGEPQGQNTGSAQLFFAITDSELPANYSVVGSVDPAGLAVLDKISKGGLTPSIRPSQDPNTGAVTYTPVPGDGTPKLTTTIEKATVS